MNNRLVTVCFREIKKNIRRFLYLAIISFLGVAVFAGMKAASTDMIKTLDTYYDENNVYDIKLISTLGLTNEDIKAISNLDNLFTVYGIHSKDALFKHNGNSIGSIRITELDNTHNQVLLREGRLPQNNNEIVIEESILRKTKIQIGDTIELDLEADDDTIKSKQLKVVGTVISPIYLTNGNGYISRGETNIGGGKIDYYSFTVKEFYNMDYYTEIYISIANNLITNSDEYNALIDEKIDLINTIKEERETTRYNEIVKKANAKVDEKEQEGLNALNEVKEQLDEANRQLEYGRWKLELGEKELKSAKNELDSNLEKINDGKAKIGEAENELANAKQQLDLAINEINSKLSKYQLDYNDLFIIKKAIYGISLTREEVISLLPTNSKCYNSLVKVVNYIYDNGYNDLCSRMINGIDKEKIISIIPKNIENYEDVCNYIRSLTYEKIRNRVITFLLDTSNAEKIKQKIPSCIIGYKYLVNAIETYELKIEDLLKLFNGIEQIKNGNEDYNNGINTIEAKKKELDEGYELYLQYVNEYNNNVALLKEKRNELNENIQKYEDGLEEYNSKKLDFEKNISDARQKVNEIEKARMFVYNRNNNNDYTTYINSVQSVENLANLFPVVFFIVAIFISLLSMSRMAFEDRGEMGTLKSLGYNNMQIRFKYIFYSISATLFGGILGSIFGFYFIPWLVFEQYSMLFGIPIFIYDNNIIPIIIGIGISIICICGSTIITINNLIKEKPTELLRPKAPPKGKKILLEKVKIIWNRFKFSNKVTARNIFRYKKRTSMTVLGIVGCTVLLIAGYAIKDSIINISNVQFGEVFKYHNTIYIDENIADEKREEIFNNEHIKEKAYTYHSKVKTKEMEVSLIVPDNEEIFKHLFILKEKGANTELELENNKVIITSKLAKKLKVKQNDKIEITDVNNNIYNFEISGIAQNYIGDFIYMNKATYEACLYNYRINMAYITFDNLENENEVTTKLLENEEILGILSNQASLESFSNLFKTLDTVVLILVIFSGTLALVVLYNLAYINISERQREIATLKVLGFNHKEVNDYIIKEEIIITILGILIGLIVGTWFGMIIVETIELDIAEFIKTITPISYLKTLGFMIVFSIIVNIRVRLVLKKIDMIESLKSIE